MKQYICLAVLVFFFGCKEEKKEMEIKKLDFTTETYKKETSLKCDPCPDVSVTIPVAKNIPVVADSINKKVFNTVRDIIYFGEQPYQASDYNTLLASFIKSYEEVVTEFTDHKVGWNGNVKGSVDYKSDEVLNIKINSYTYTGGAHGYESNQSLLFNPKTGKTLKRNNIIKNEEGFKAFAEKKFRNEFNLSPEKPINSTGLMFENGVFELPQNIFFTKNGLLLYYNTYEIASYAEGPKELLLTYDEVEEFLLIK